MFRRQVQPPYPRFFYRYAAINPSDPVSVDRMRDVIVRSELWLPNCLEQG